MRSRILKSILSLPRLVLCAVVLYGLGAVAAELPQQSSQAGGVTVRVKPADVSPAAATWRFEVVLETHSGDLSEDLARIAFMVDAAGRRYPAAGWEGDPAGGHHRKGVLQFKAMSPRPGAIELRILRPGEAAPRSFRWKLT
ncbi:MAG: hypothetical protein HYY28_00750 [Betaproteobacteria bacterium]|nr:hypothetical protein [Betaproteobacteria bacterium]